MANANEKIAITPVIELAADSLQKQPTAMRIVARAGVSKAGAAVYLSSICHAGGEP
jgi:hypothetical protein